ncbi:MAG: filamentous hemagglutinin N-terminal domain-containing protein [Prosthecobacter sp.]
MAPGHPSLRRVHAYTLAGLCWLVLVASDFCLANPEGGVVVLGAASIQNSVPGLTTIVQDSNRAVIDWQSFSIQAGERTNFIVPDATSATLNRVIGCDPSILNGSLTSNGHLFLINSNGIVFGEGSSVDVASLTASSLDIHNSAFMAGGEMFFRGTSEAAVRNAGAITASTGDVFLIGYQVSNAGSIRAPNGTVGLAAGSEVLIVPVGDERVVVRGAAGSRKKTGVSNSGIIEANMAELKAHNGNAYALAIRNTGRIAATGVVKQGGRILLTANGGKIKSSGSLVARDKSGNGGEIRVKAGIGGQATISGRVDADGPGGAGGRISISGEKVEIRRAIEVTADGDTVGGVIEIGSNAEFDSDQTVASVTTIEGVVRADSTNGVGGKIRLGGQTLVIREDSMISANGATDGGHIIAGGADAESNAFAASCISIECGAVLSANAMTGGNGGLVSIVSSNNLVVQGHVEARGGADSGDGGLVMLSAGETLSINRLAKRVNVTGAGGSSGTLVLQSSEFVISGAVTWQEHGALANTLGASDVADFLDTANLTVRTKIGGDAGNGNIYVKDRIAWTSGNALTIRSDCDVLFLCGDAGPGAVESVGEGGVLISAARFVLLDEGAYITTTSGNVEIRANQRFNSSPEQFGIKIAGRITSESGDVSLVGEGIEVSGGLIDAGLGTILMDGNDGAIRLDGALKTANETVQAVRIIDAAWVSLGDITTGAGGAVTLGGAGDDNLSGPVTQTGRIVAGTVTGNTGSSVTLDGNNTVVNLGELRTVGRFVFEDVSGGLNMTGDVETNGGSAEISTSGGALAVGGHSVSTSGGDVKLSGTGVTSSGGGVDAGGGTILVDGNDGGINLKGTLTTTNETAQAVRIIDAANASLGDIKTGAGGTVTLGGAGGDNLSGPVTQSGRIVAGTLTGNTGSSVTLDGNNTVVNLGELKTVGRFVFEDVSGGLNVTGDVETNGGPAKISTSGGALAMGGHSVSTSGGDVELSGDGVTSSGGVVEAAGGIISVSGNGGSVNLAGDLTTTNGTSQAVRIGDAEMASLGNITTGNAGTVTLDNVAGNVSQTGIIQTGTVVVSGNGVFALTSSANQFHNIVTNGAVGSLSLVNAVGLTIGSVSGLNAVSDIAITVTGDNALVIGNDVISQSGSVALSASEIAVDGATIASAGAAPVSLTAGRFVLENQPEIGGIMSGTSGAAELVLDDSNLTSGQIYNLNANTLTAGSRSYAFQGVSSVRLDLGEGNDTSKTDFFIFDQFLNAGGGTNQLFVGGSPVSSSPLTRPGFGTIAFSGFELAPPPASAPPPTAPSIGGALLQNATPGVGGDSSSGSSETNNFNSTSTSGASSGGGVSVGGGGASAAVGGGVASGVAGVSGVIGQSLGVVSAGGGAPPSFGVQSQMNAVSSAAAESELNAALGGDGTMGVRSSTGLVSVDPGGVPPSAGSVAQLESNMDLLALSELSFGAIGVSDVTVTSQLGVQSLTLGGALPKLAVQQGMGQILSPDSYSRLSQALGGDGTAWIDSGMGSVRVDLQEIVVPSLTDAILGSAMMPGPFAELSLTLGGSGEFLVTPSLGMATIDASGVPASSGIAVVVRSNLSVSTQSRLSLMLGGDGMVLLLPEDGIRSIACNDDLPSQQVTAQIAASVSAESLEELDNATR